MRFSRALEALWELVRAGNKYIDTMEPWALNREGRSDRLAGVMRRTLEVCRVAGTLLSPIFPGKAGELLAKLGVDAPSLDGVGQLDQLTEGREVSAGDPLFPRMMALPDRIQAVLEQVQEDQETPMEEPKVTPEPTPAEEKPTPAEEPAPRIKIDDFAKVQLRSGQVLTAEPHPNADRLLVLTVDVGEPEPRTIVAGLASRYAPDQLVGLRVVVVVNLKPAKLRGIRSEGMILAAGGGAVQAMVTLSEDVEPGTVIR
jgi:methionyl-tRNA synthetase